MYWLLTGKHVPTMIPKGSTGNGLQLRSDPGSEQLTPPIETRPACPPALSTLVMECVAKAESDRPTHMQAVMDRAEIAAVQARRAEEAAPAEQPIEGESLAKK